MITIVTKAEYEAAKTQRDAARAAKRAASDVIKAQTQPLSPGAQTAVKNAHQDFVNQGASVRELTLAMGDYRRANPRPVNPRKTGK
jgi:vacuolar-type H+-ATPase subunit H